MMNILSCEVSTKRGQSQPGMNRPGFHAAVLLAASSPPLTREPESGHSQRMTRMHPPKSEYRANWNGCIRQARPGKHDDDWDKLWVGRSHQKAYQNLVCIATMETSTETIRLDLSLKTFFRAVVTRGRTA